MTTDEKLLSAFESLANSLNALNDKLSLIGEIMLQETKAINKMSATFGAVLEDFVTVKENVLYIRRNTPKLARKKRFKVVPR